MKRLLMWVTLLMVAAGLLAACGSKQPAGSAPDGYTNLTPSELNTMLANKDFLLVNVHVPYAGEIASTDAFIPFEASAQQRVSEYPADKSARIVLYCRSGSMSTTVAEALVAAGYTNVYELDGGMNGWKDAGYELINK